MYAYLMPEYENVYQVVIDDLRAHITLQIAHIADQNNLRFQLIQEELDRRFREVQLQIDQRFDSSKQAVDAALISADKAVQAALKSAETAVNKADVAAEKRFDSVNEFRQTLSDQTKSFVTSDRYDGLGSRVDDLRDRLTRVESVAQGASTAQAVSRADRGLAIQGSDSQQNADYYRQAQMKAWISMGIAVIAVLASIVSIIVVVLVH